MEPEENQDQVEKNLAEMDYNSSEDIFNKEKHISLDGDGNPITNQNQKDEMPFGLDIPGFEDDDNYEQLNSQIPTEDESLHKGNEIEE
ncbi:hypothetical protein [Frigoriflavimonas asaccharolytica]|uniref:Uncharacterized protein n=1 Tax=Frigoriflavimonas asaccharolytica TaxID=2735899 RepID=A0A8J8KAM1_9FLAO|nr:hypothetical protein [Frigoriflavimonas asaccharolytica]NRS91624.1 hypothetical protein [Frigoriflavimonas asaccharolytica]